MHAIPSAAPPAGLGILSIDHVGVAVPDLEAAITFQVEVLGGTVTHRETNDEQGVSEAMISWADGAQVQLLAPLTPDSPIAGFLERRGPGLQQLAFRVRDVRTATDAAKAAGLRPLYEVPRRGTGGSLINFLHPGAVGGVLIELVQPPSPPSDQEVVV